MLRPHHRANMARGGYESGSASTFSMDLSTMLATSLGRELSAIFWRRPTELQTRRNHHTCHIVTKRVSLICFMEYISVFGGLADIATGKRHGGFSGPDDAASRGSSNLSSHRSQYACALWFRRVLAFLIMWF